MFVIMYIRGSVKRDTLKILNLCDRIKFASDPVCVKLLFIKNELSLLNSPINEFIGFKEESTMVKGDALEL